MATYNISVTTAIIQADSQPSNKENTIYSRGNRLFFENTELNSSIYNDIDFSISTFSQRDDDEAKIFSFILNRSKNDTLGNHTSVTQDDKIGSILFRGSDGNIFRNAAEITAISESDNTGALLFSTTPLGNSNNQYNTNSVEAMRITKEGLVSIGSKNVNQLRLDSNNTKLLIQNGTMTLRTNAGENFYYNKLIFDKSANNTDGEQSQVLANNIVGGVEFRGSDGSEYKPIASIRSETVKDTGVNSSTGKIIFSTSNDTTEPVDWITLNQDGDFTVPKLITSNLSVKEVVNSVCIKKDILVKGTSFFSGQVNISNNLCVSKTIFANGIPGLMVNNVLLTSRPNEPKKYGYINFGDVAGVHGYGLRAKYNSRNNLKLLDDVKIQFKNEGETNWRDIGNAQGAIANVSNSNKGFIPTFTGTNNDISGNKSLQFLGKHLFINANVNLTNNLNIGGKLSVGKDSFFKNNLNVKNNLIVQNLTNITGNLSVRGITNLSGNLHVGNVLCVRKTLSVSSIGGIYNEGDLSVGGDVVIGGTLKIPRIDEAQFTITGKANFDKGLNVFGRTNINGNLSVQGFTNLKSNLTIDTLSHTNISKFLSIGGTANLNSLKVNNNFFGKGVFQVDSNLVVNSDTNCTTLVATGTTDIGGNILCNNLSVANNFTVVQDMTIDNDLLINNTLSVSGNTILNGDFNVAKKTNIDGSLGVNNNVNLNSNVRIVGMTNIKGVLKVDGSTNIGRNLTLGSNTYDISPSLWYKLNGNVLDSSENNYHGTLVNAVLTENRFGEPESAYNFHAVDRYIALSGQFSDTGDANATALLSENVRSSLIAFYKFDLNADDSSGNNYNATNNGATIEDPGVDGLGIETSFGFNGVSNYVNAPNPSQDLSGNLTISLWFYLNNLTGTQTLVSKGFNKEFELQIDGGMLKLLNGSADGHYSYTGPDLSNLSFNVWYNLIVIRSGSGSSWTSSFYINGSLQNTASGVLASGSEANIPQASTNNVFIGARNNSTIAENYFNGRLDNVRYYNRTLSTDEIMEIYLGLIPKLTMSFWFRTSDISPRQYFLSLNNNTQASSRTCELSLYLQEGAIIANYRPLNGSSNLFTLNNAIEKNRWYHIVFETNQLDDIYNLYINGVLRQTATIPKGYTFFNWYLGSATDDRDDNIFDKHLRGEMDDFKVIRTSLTQEQINLLYASRDNEPHLFISNNLSVGGTSYLSDVNITKNIRVEGHVNFRSVLQVNGKIHTDNNIKIHPNRYLNFNTEVFGTGTDGVGIRDNSGTMQFRNAGSLWQNIVETSNAISSLSDAGKNRLITFTGVNSIKGESGLLFNGNNLLVNGKVNILNNLCIGRNLSIGTRETEGIGSVISLGFGSKGSTSKTFTYSGEGSAKDNITTAIGFNATASGLNATSIGLRTSSRSFSQTTLGMYSKSISSSSSDYVLSDPVFVIGSGTSDSSRKNALVMRKSGDTEIFGNVNIIKSLNVSGHVNISQSMNVDVDKFERSIINVSDGINIGNSVKKNTPVGIEALKNNNSGDNNNTAYGYRAGYSIQSGGHNIYVGSLAGGDYSQTKTDGSYNIGLGSGSGRYITNGMNNILIGYNSGSEITHCGRNNIIIGSESELSSSTSLNEIVIGDNLRGHGENIATLGNNNLISITPDSKSKVDIGSKSYNLKAVYANRIITVSENAPWKQLGGDTDMLGLSDNIGGSSVSTNSDGTIVAVGEPYYTVRAGRVRVFKYSGNSWELLGGDTDIVGTISYSYTGWSVSLNSNGTIVAVGEPYYEYDGEGSSTNRGRVRVFKYNGSSWELLGNAIVGEVISLAGIGVSINSSGNIVAVSQPNYYRPEAAAVVGRVSVYKYNGILWNLLGGENDINGVSFNGVWYVSLNSNGTILAVAEPFYEYDEEGSSTNRGRVRVFKYNGSSWELLGGETDIVGNSGDEAGTSVSINSYGNIVAVGEYNYEYDVEGSSTNRGRVRVFKYNGSSWKLLGGETDIVGETGVETGWSVSINSEGNILAVGETSYENDGEGSSTNRGRVRVFKYNGSSWELLGGETDIVGNSGDYAGWSVSLNSNGTIVAVLAFTDEYDGEGSYTNRGRARVFQLDNLTNVRIGENSGNLIGSRPQAIYNTIIGSNSDISLANGSNQIVIGYNVTGSGNNTMTLGNTYLTDVYLGQCSMATLHCNSIFAKGNVNIAGKLNVAGSVNIAGTFHANDIKLLSGKYINFGPITGSNGYGLRENSGDIQFKNSGGSWAKIQTFPDSLSNNLNVFGPTNLNGTLSVLGNTNLAGELKVGNNFNISGKLSVGGTSYFKSSLSVSGTTIINNNLSVRGRTNIGGGLNVSGQTNLNGTLSVSGASYLSSANIKGNLSVLGGVNIKGTLNVRDTLYAKNIVQPFEQINEGNNPYGYGNSLKIRLEFESNANDSSGNGNDFTVSTGHPDYPDIDDFGPGRQIGGRTAWKSSEGFNGSITRNIDFNSGQFTIMLWFQLRSPGVGNLRDYDYNMVYSNAFEATLRIQSTGHPDYNDYAQLFLNGNGGFSEYIDDPLTNVISNALNSGQATNWNHFAFVVDGSVNKNVKIYVNGIELYDKIYSNMSSDWSSSYPFQLMYDGVNAYMSDFRMYNELVDGSIISSIYTGLISKISYINFGHKTGTDGYGLRNSDTYMQYKNKTSTSWTQVGYQENFSSGLKVTGSTNIAGTLSVSGHTTISGDLMVGGNLNIANKLSVGGSSYFSNVNIRHNIKIDERPANIGAGILAAGNLAAWNNLRFGVMYKNELFINLIGLRSDGDSDVIGKQGGTANSHFGQITYEKFGFVKSISMRCLERADSSYRQFYLATDSSSLSEGDDGSGINHLTGGSVNMASVGQINVYPISSATITSDINNHFIYLLGGGGVDYTTGMFLITFFGW